MSTNSDRGAMPPANSTADRESLEPRLVLGALALLAGVGIFVAAGMPELLPFRLPRSWYLHRPLWLMFGLLLLAVGWLLQRKQPLRFVDDPGWQPHVPGVRFEKLIVYSRAECHLCDDAKAVLASYAEFLPDIQEIDIDTDPQLQQQFGTSIPVVELDGQVRFRGRIDEALLRRLINGTPPRARD